MSESNLLALLNVLVAVVGVLFVVLAAFEYWQLQKLREDFKDFQKDLMREIHTAQKAMQRVIASYHVEDPQRRIELLNSALDINPKVFNAYNALGYAYLEQGKEDEAADAFKEAIQQHPEDKEGYFDLAGIYLRKKRYDLVRKYLDRAIKVDPSSVKDIKQDERFRSFLEKVA